MTDMMITISMQIFEDMADRIEELEAKLEKAMEALQKIKQPYPADAHRLIHGDRQIIEIADAILAELKGQDDG